MTLFRTELSENFELIGIKITIPSHEYKARANGVLVGYANCEQEEIGRIKIDSREVWEATKVHGTYINYRSSARKQLQAMAGL